LNATLKKFTTDPERFSALSRRNSVEAIRRFDWSYRWREMLRIVGMEPSLRHLEREKQLAQLAALAEATP
jgi:hypothetical protein